MGGCDKEGQSLWRIKSDKGYEGQKEGFLKYISSKRKIWENVGLLLNQMHVMVTEDTEKAQLLNVSVFSAEVGNPRLWK